MQGFSRSLPLLFVATLSLSACDKTPTGLRDTPGPNNPFSTVADGHGSIPLSVKNLGKLIPQFLIPGYPDLTVTCSSGGNVVTGIAFDGFYIYVAHGDFVNSCITRYVASTGAYVDQKFFRPDTRGITWVPGLGKLVARTYGGLDGGQDNPAEVGRFFSVDYNAGTAVLLTNYDVQSCNPQGQPSVDPDGLAYWENCGTSLNHRQMSDGAVLSTIASVNPFFPGTAPVAVGDGGLMMPSGQPNQYAVWNRATSGFIVNVQSTSSNGCDGYGVGLGPDGSKMGVNLDCSTVRIESLGGGTHGLLAPYPGVPVTSHVKLCKDASSPSGTYGFSIGSSGTVAGDVVQASAALSPGQCRIVFSRTAASNVTTTLTITEVYSPGAVVSSISRTQFGTTTVFSGSNPTVTVSANSSHGGVVTYTNVVQQLL